MISAKIKAKELPASFYLYPEFFCIIRDNVNTFSVTANLELIDEVS